MLSELSWMNLKLCFLRYWLFDPTGCVLFPSVRLFEFGHVRRFLRCYLYEPRGSFFKLFFLSFSFLAEMSNSYVTWASSVSWYSYQWIYTPALSIFCFFEVFHRFPVDLIIEMFQQLAGENITPKVVASRRKITKLLISVQISLQRCSCHLLTICFISCGANAAQASVQ